MQKSRDAFRTISEVAEWLDVPTHVLRFWESRFSQIKPVKRAGGRRYYRPSDMRVIGGVKTLLHDQGMTIRGVQKLFREEGIKHVSGFSAKLDGEDGEASVEDQSLVIDRDAISATPAAPAARSSREAIPDPIVDDVDDVVEPADDIVSETSEPVFSHHGRMRGTPPANPAPAVESEPVSSASTTGSVPEPAPEPNTPSLPPEAESTAASTDQLGPTIPATPDVPDIDPEDDAPEYQSNPGIAAQLLMADRTVLEAHRADVMQAAERLKALLATAQ